MKKNKETIQDLSALRQIFGLPLDLPAEESDQSTSEDSIADTRHFQSIVRIHLQRLKGNKEATLIKGLHHTKDGLEALCSELKKYCGVGGAVKEKDILLQGNHRQKVVDYLIGKGYKNTKLAGG